MRLLNVVECQYNHARKHLLLHEFVALVTNVKKNSHVNFNSKSSMKALMKQLSLASEAYNIKESGDKWSQIADLDFVVSIPEVKGYHFTATNSHTKTRSFLRASFSLV